MKIVVLANNWVGWRLTHWLTRQGVDLCGLVVHPLARSRFRHQILLASGLPWDRIIEGPQLKDAAHRARLLSHAPDLAVSLYFGYILRREFITAFPQGVLNLHPAWLPFNRGAYPNVWSIVEQTPAGVSLHYVDDGIDTGDVVAQRPVTAEAADTGATLQRKLDDASVALFRETWPAIERGHVSRTPQQPGGSRHSVRDAETLDCIELDQTYTARELIDILRARTFAPYPGAYFESEGTRVYMRLELSPSP